MERFSPATDILLAKKLAGECTPSELEQINTWLNTSSKNKKYYQSLQKVWIHSDAKMTTSTSAEAATQQRKNQLNRPTVQPNLSVNYKRQLLRSAAAVLMFVTAVFFFKKPSTVGANEVPVLTATETSLQDTLTDGSIIVISPNSALVLASDFNKKERRMRLKGQAEFKVTTNHNKAPFVVEVQNLEVTAVGTAFTIDERRQKDIIYVHVKEGLVVVKNPSSQIELHSGDLGVFDTQLDILKKEKPSKVSDLGRLFRFEQTNLKQVTERLELSYGVPIRLINKDLETCQLTARYNKLPLEDVLELIGDSFSIDIKKVDNGYVIDGYGCIQ